MKRFLLSIVAFALALTASAQVNVQQQQKYRGIECNPIVEQHSQAVSKTQKKIATNQRWLGNYSSDELEEAHSGLGLSSCPGKNKVAVNLTESMLEPYVGMKIVGIRFGLCEDIGQSAVFLSRLEGDIPGQVLSSKIVQSGNIGWNQELFSAPYIIKAGETLVAGFDYTQYGENDESGKSPYPLSAVYEGDGSQTFWIWCASDGMDYSWSQFKAGGRCISIQVLVEGNIPEHCVTPNKLKTARGPINGSGKSLVRIYNNSAYTVSEVGYVVTVDGITTRERTVAVRDGGIAQGKSGYFDAIIPCGTTEGVKRVKLEVKRVNGNNNESPTPVVEGKVNVSDNRFERNLCIEEFTTEECPNCPRVAGFLAEYLKNADHNRVYAVCHHSGYGTDWLTQPCDRDLLFLYNDGGIIYAPAMMFNREPDFYSHYARGEMDNVIMPRSVDEIESYAKYYLEQTDADVKLDMNVVYNANTNSYNITVKGVSNDVFDKESARLTLYVTEDNVAAQKQANGGDDYMHQHVIRKYNTSWGELLNWEGNEFSATYEWSLDGEWKKEDIRFVAFVNKFNFSDCLDNRLENVIGMSLSDATSIQAIDADDNAVEVARYNAAGLRINGGQKGLNIVKLSNGKTKKVMVTD